MNRFRMLIFIFAFAGLLLANSIPTYLIYVESKEQTNNYYNFSATLVAISIPEDRTTLKERLETGKVDPSTIINNFKYSPISEGNISVYSINPTNPNDKQLICEFKTDKNGKGSCIGYLSNLNRVVMFRFEGNGSYAPSQFTISIPATFSIPPFNELIDSSWLIIFFTIGVLIAALYASGRDPLASLDITTPKTKGPSYPKPQKITFSKLPTAPLFVYTAIPTSKIISTTSALSKYATPEEKKTLNQIRNQAVVLPPLAASNLIKFVVDRDMMNRIKKKQEWARNRLKETEEKLSLLKSKPKPKSSDEIFKMKVDKTDLENRLQLYKEELKSAMDATNKIIQVGAVASAINFDPDSLSLTIEKSKEILKEELKNKENLNEKTKLVSNSLVRNRTRERVDELIKNLVPKDIPEEITTTQIKPVIQAKVELDRIFISKTIQAFNKMEPLLENKIKLDEIGKSDFVNKAKTTMNLIKKYKPPEYKKLLKEIKEISLAKEEYDNQLKQLEKLLRQYKSAIERNDEKLKDELIMKIGLLYYRLIRRAKAYLEEIDTGKYDSDFKVEGFEDLISEK